MLQQVGLQAVKGLLRLVGWEQKSPSLGTKDGVTLPHSFHKFSSFGSGGWEQKSLVTASPCHRHL